MNFDEVTPMSLPIEQQREIKPLTHFPGEVETIRPDDIPKAPGQNDNLPRTSLVLYIYRVPGKRDLFLTQHKIPNDHPTATDVNGSSYYLRYDNWSGPTRNYTSQAFNDSASSSTAQQREWRNTSQRNLDERGMIGPLGAKMCLVSVNMARDDIREIGTLIDPKMPGLVYAPENKYRAPAANNTNAENPLYIDLHPKAYKDFGADVAYHQGKAFTRRVFRGEAFKQHYHFTSPWGGKVTLERHAHGKPTFKAFHRMPNSRAFDGILTSELRPNFSPYRKVYEPSSSGVSIHRPSFDSTTSASEDGRLSTPRNRLARFRHRSEQISGSAKERFNTMLNSRMQTYDDFTYHSSDFNMQLAHEPLGGGTGDEAKLAKLIIYPEGQDFIDLVVAANVLIFNATYERAMPWLHQDVISKQ